MAVKYFLFVTRQNERPLEVVVIHIGGYLLKEDCFYDKFGDQVAEYRFNRTKFNHDRLMRMCKTALIKLYDEDKSSVN